MPQRLPLLSGLLRFLASLRLAVVLISLSAVVLAWATFVESRYGTEAVWFGVYETGWFAALMGLLGVNVLCAALVRLPWKRHQTGFLITHAGIIVLLIGCLLTRLHGIDAQLPVFEGGTAHLAFEDTQHFELEIDDGLPRKPSGQTGAARGRDPAPRRASAVDRPVPVSEGERPSRGETIKIPFAAGPFNWEEYSRLFWFPWRLSHRDRGVIYDRDGIRLEVLDYYSDSELEAAEPLRLRVKGDSGQWTTVELRVERLQDPHSPHATAGLGQRQRLPGERWIVFWVADGRAETEAFRNSRPAGPLGKLGQVVLYAGGQPYHFGVETLQANQRVPIGNTGMHVELVQFDPRLPSVILRIHRGDRQPHRMVLWADIPEFNQQDKEYGVFGTYWFDTANVPEEDDPAATAVPEMRKLRRPRIDVIQGADQRLYYRTWDSPELGTVAALPADGTRVMAFDGTASPVSLYVEKFIPHDRPGVLVKPVPYVQGEKKSFKRRQAKVRLTVDGDRETFWLEGRMKQPNIGPPGEEQRKVVHGDGRRVAITLAWDRVDVGFRLYLRNFQRKLDPGSSMASHYSSLVDLVDREEANKRLQRDVLITLNAPVNFSDPYTGRSYRVYQEAYRGPFKPGEPMFEENVDADSPRDQLFLSWLTVNYDPGRGLKYFGSLLIVAGIATMFYMKAYFFRKRRPQDPT
jgi:hypothetical protein